MSKNNAVEYVKDRFYEIEEKNLLEALSVFSNRENLILALLVALGFPETIKEIDAETESYHAVIQGVRVDLIFYNALTHDLSGNAASDLKDAYSVVLLIEGKLSDALYYPADLRKKAVEYAIQSAGVTDDFFNKILAGWKVFR